MTIRSDNKQVIAIGWDVRGWRSRDQAVAVLAFDDDSSSLHWLGVSGQFQFSVDKPLGLSSLIEPAIGGQLDSINLKNTQIVIGIDAPLAFPRKFVELFLAKNESTIFPPDKEINNSLAYRDCERWVYEQHSKKPLSAAFDKLGNNATLALCMAQSLKTEGFKIIPLDVNTSDRAVIEVYPGITKRGKKKIDRAIKSVDRHIPAKLSPGTDQYDAAICAILAATFAGKGSDLELPDLVPPDSRFDNNEGWIYGLPADFVSAES